MVDVSWERLQVHGNGWGGNFVDPQNPAHSLMSRSEALDALEWIRGRMWTDHTMATPLDMQNLETRQTFIQQRIAMVEDGSWALKDILENAPFRVGVAPFPAGPARQSDLGYYRRLCHLRRHQVSRGRLGAAQFLTDREYARATAQAHRLQPARASLVLHPCDQETSPSKDRYDLISPPVVRTPLGH